MASGKVLKNLVTPIRRKTTFSIPLSALFLRPFDMKELLNNQRVYERMANAVNPYGDGKATLRILDAIRYHFKVWDERPAEFMGDLAANPPLLWPNR